VARIAEFDVKEAICLKRSFSEIPNVDIGKLQMYLEGNQSALNVITSRIMRLDGALHFADMVKKLTPNANQDEIAKYHRDVVRTAPTDCKLIKLTSGREGGRC